MNENNERNIPEEQSGQSGQQGASQPSAGTGGAGNSYWSSQDARRYQEQRTYGQGYQPPYQNQGQPYQGQPQGQTQPQQQQQGQGQVNPYRYGQYPGYQQPNQQQQPYGSNPYQYNSNAGWQAPRTQEEKYEWKFQDYEKLEKKDGKRRSKGLVVFSIFLACVLGIGAIGGITYSIFGFEENRSSILDGDPSGAGEAETSTPDSEAAQEGGSTAQLELSGKPETDDGIPTDGPLTIPQIAKMVSPSVVGVSTFQGAQFYEPISAGSGIIMSADGYIITNAHVVADGTDFKVQLHDSTPYDAVLIGSDTTTDLAILKIEAEGLVAAAFGDSDEVEVGETVVAIGNPGGQELAGSVTRGIVSAVNREVRTSTTTYATYIQTDAAINPGNSGGALVNEFGQVIGINSSKIIAAGYEGIGFAIPITSAKPVLDDIIQNGRVTGRVMLGISCSVVDEVDARKYGIPMGVVIQEIYDQSDMIGKDIQKGDIITHIDGERVYDLNDVQAMLADRTVGDSVTLTFYRRITASRGLDFDVEVKLVENEG